MAKISIIVPVYNVEKYIKKTFDSLQNQTIGFKNLEVIFVDDCSTDNSGNIIDKWGEKYNNVIPMHLKENSGASGKPRNVGLDNATSDYIFFLDADDYIATNTLEELYKNALSNNSDLVIFKIARFYDEGEIIYSQPGFDLDIYFGDVEFDNFTFNYKEIKPYVLNKSYSAWSKLYKKTLFDEFDDLKFPVTIAYEDVIFHIKTLIRASKISFSPNFFYYYRLSNENSITHTESNALDIFTVINSVEDFLINNNLMDEFEKEFINFKVHQINYYTTFSNSEEVFKLGKSELSKLNFENSIIINRFALDDYNLILNSESLTLSKTLLIFSFLVPYFVFFFYSFLYSFFGFEDSFFVFWHCFLECIFDFITCAFYFFIFKVVYEFFVSWNY